MVIQQHQVTIIQVSLWYTPTIIRVGTSDTWYILTIIQVNTSDLWYILTIIRVSASNTWYIIYHQLVTIIRVGI